MMNVVTATTARNALKNVMQFEMNSLLNNALKQNVLAVMQEHVKNMELLRNQPRLKFVQSAKNLIVKMVLVEFQLLSAKSAKILILNVLDVKSVKCATLLLVEMVLVDSLLRLALNV